jgi:hypothetical protein
MYSTNSVFRKELFFAAFKDLDQVVGRRILGMLSTMLQRDISLDIPFSVVQR